MSVTVANLPESLLQIPDGVEVFWFECGGGAILGNDPLTIVQGRLPEDVGVLEDAIRAHEGSFPAGGLGGWVSYEGDFRFGVFEELIRHPSHPQESPQLSVSGTCEPSLRWTDRGDREAFLGNVRRIQDWIAAGDIYQACLTYQWTGEFSGDALALFRRLRAASPCPYGAFLRGKSKSILSLSPELFLRMEDRNILTRPIKGTRPRGGGREADEARVRELLASPKERAELLMITDLERNDLGQVCEFGSIRVPELFRVETFSHVHHLVSTVSGSLRREVSHPAALAACFPGGSISGAPKKRAMEILRELESRPRGVYTGSIGYFGFDKTSCFNIAIRTLEIDGKGVARYGTGAGIVADSDPEKEWDETLAKARVVDPDHALC